MAHDLDLIKLELTHLREQMENEKRHDRELIATTYASDQRNTQKDLDELGGRINRLWEDRDNIAKEYRLRLEAAIEKTEAMIRPLAAQLSKIGKPDWMVLGSLVSIFVVIVSGAGFLVSQQIQVSNQPVNMSVERLKADNASFETRLRQVEASTAASAGADVESRGDRLRLNARIAATETGIAASDASRREFEAKQTATNTEIETQFCAADAFRNLMHATDMRTVSVLWRRTAPDEIYPTDNAYYPIICNRPARQ